MKFVQTTIKILGHDWGVRFCSRRHFRKKHGKGAEAVAVLHRKRIDFQRKSLVWETAVHELVHAYYEELCARSADLESAQLEELVCDLMGKYGKRIWKQADDLIALNKHLRRNIRRGRNDKGRGKGKVRGNRRGSLEGRG